MTDASLARTRELFNRTLGEERLKIDRDVDQSGVHPGAVVIRQWL